MLQLTNFEFILDELKDNYCLDNGRHATDPVFMFKYLIIKVITGLSDVDLVAHTLYDLSFKYFLGMDPLDTELINPATLRSLEERD